MSGQVEDGDLDVKLSMALVVSGRYRDLMQIRALVREKVAKSEGARFIHGTISSVPLYIIKEPDWRWLQEYDAKASGHISLEQHGGDKPDG